MNEKSQSFFENYNLNSFYIYLIIELIAVILSVIIPHNFIILIHAYYGCGHHSGGIDGDLWEWGRALGFTALIWFIISSLQGFTMNKHAKFFHKKGKRKARDIHCISSILCVFFAGVHVYLLFVSEPWRSIFLKTDSEHFSWRIFQFKIGTGVYFMTVMTIVSMLSFAARDTKFMKKIGYKRFRWIHWIMIISTVILIVHILYINTEIWIIYGDKLR
jgi:predicted ferric reductase